MAYPSETTGFSAHAPCTQYMITNRNYTNERERERERKRERERSRSRSIYI